MIAPGFRPTRASRGLAPLSLGLLVFLFAAPPAFAQGEWTGDFSIPSFDGATRAGAILDGRYVVAGEFQWAGGTRASNVAQWTGAQWEPVGSGLHAPVNRLAIWGSKLLAGVASDNVTAPVMQFDGIDWRPLGAGVYGETDALYVDGNTVYAAGLFYLNAVGTGYRVIRWTGAQWEPVGGVFDNRVTAITVWNGQLYAGGSFLYGDAEYLSRIGRWDGAHWRNVGGGLGAGSGIRVAALAVFQDRLVAGGAFGSVGAVEANGIAAWDGAAWSALPGTPDDDIVYDLEVDGGRLLVAGVLQVPVVYASGLAAFDGQSWDVDPTHPGWGVRDVAAADGAVLAVGSLSDLATGVGPPFSSTLVRNVVVRDPAWRPLEAWQPTMRGLRGPAWTAVNALHVHGGELFAGGYFQQAADPPGWKPAEGVARWDGDRWQPLAGNLRGWVYALASWNGHLVAGGSIAAGDATEYSPVAAWDGSQWHAIGPLGGTVLAVVAWQDALVAVGALRLPTEAVDVTHPVMIHRGAGWEVLDGLQSMSQTEASAVAVFGGNLYVGGHNLWIPGTGWFPLVRWDGSAWAAVSGAPQRPVTSLRLLRDGLWLGLRSSYTDAFGAVWSYDGTDWTDHGLPGWTVLDLAMADGSQPIAAGVGPLGSGTATLARVVNGDWAPFPDTPDHPVEALAQLGRDLFVGGTFTNAGGRPAEAIARFSLGGPAGTPRVPVALSVGPNPVTDVANFRFTLTRRGRVRLTIHDVTGALVARPLDETLDPGTIERAWLPRAQGGLRSGVYFAKLSAPEGEASARIVVVR